MLVGTAALVYALTVAAPAPQAPQPRAPETDQTVPVTRGTRLAIDNYAGEVVIHTWDKDALRVQARHPSRMRINVRTGASTVTIGASSSSGPNGSVDYDITVPAWMPMKVEGQYNYVTIDGAQSDVSVVTVRGDIVLKGGSGPVTARTIEGEIIVDGARGKVDLRSVNEGIKVTGASGDITAETTNGSITLARIESSSVQAATVNGDITYDGTIAANGHYSATSHNGDIVVVVPDNANATLNIRTYTGDFSTSLALKGPDRSEARRGKRLTYTLGNGSADVELESFGGSIRVRRAGDARRGRDR